MKSMSIKVSAFATVSNVGPGFDIMGFAVDVEAEEMIVNLKEKPGIKILKSLGNKNQYPLNLEKNTAAVAVKKMLSFLGLNIGVEVRIKKKIVPGSGLGSSAASAVAAPFALNELLGRPFTKKDLLLFALEGEAAASGSFHADNVAPCLFGGFVLIREYNPPDLINLPVPKNLYCTIIHPQFSIKTSEARKILRKEYSLKDVTVQSGNSSALIAGIMKRDFELVKRSMNDLISEPARSKLIPGFYEIKEAALNAGAYGCTISGSGPAIFALSDSERNARIIGHAMKKVSDAYKRKNIVYVSKINLSGPVVKG